MRLPSCTRCDVLVVTKLPPRCCVPARHMLRLYLKLKAGVDNEDFSVLPEVHASSTASIMFTNHTHKRSSPMPNSHVCMCLSSAQVPA